MKMSYEYPLKVSMETKMLEFAKKLKQAKIISDEHFDKIVQKNDINVIGDNNKTLLQILCTDKDVDCAQVNQAIEFGAHPSQSNMYFMTPLMYAMRAGRKDVYDVLKNLGDHNYEAFNILSENFVNLAIQGGNESILQDVLKKIQNPTLTDLNGRTPLHYAARNDSALIKVLLEDNRFQAVKAKPDIYGDTAQDLAARYKLEKAFQALTGSSDMSSSPKFDQPLLDIGQTAIENKLKAYLKNQGRDPSIIDARGMCNGWAFLYQSYLPDREDEYFDILSFIASWDGNKDSFGTLALPKSLQEKYPLRNTKEGVRTSAEDIFEQLINDLVVFFSATPAIHKLELGLGQQSRVAQLNLLTSTNRSIEPIFNLGNITLNRKQLIEQLEYMRTFPGLTVDIGGAQHQISLYITKDGKYKLYDSAISGRIGEMDNSHEVADVLIKNKYLRQLLTDQYWLEISTYRISKEKQINLQRLPSTYDFNQNPNGFNALHYAVLENDVKKVEELMISNPALIYKQNAHQQTPLDLVFMNHRLDCFNTIIQSNHIDSDVLETIASKCIHSENTDFFRSYIKSQTKLDANFLWISIMGEFNTISIESKYQKSMILFKQMEGEIDLSKIPKRSMYPPLMSAIQANHKPFFDYMLANNTSLLSKDKFDENSIYTVCLDHSDDYYIKQVLNHVGDKIDELDQFGNNLLHWAIIKGKPNVVKECIEKGASLDLENNQDKTPLELLKEHPNAEIDKLLSKREVTKERRKSLRFSKGTIEQPLAPNNENAPINVGKKVKPSNP